MKDFSKSDLKTGMMVMLRNGAKYFVYKNTSGGSILMSVQCMGHMKDLNSYDKNLLNKKGMKQLDVVNVFDATKAHLFQVDKYKKIWERPYGKDRVCLVNFPNNDKEYAFSLPGTLVDVRAGEKVLARMRNGQAAIVVVKKIYPDTNSVDLKGVEQPLCHILSTYEQGLQTQD